MPQRFTIIAHFVAWHDKIDAARDRLLSMIPPTRAEPGCVEYRLQQDRTAPAEFTFFEVFADQEAWDLHMQAPCVRDLLADITVLFVSHPHIRQMTEIQEYGLTDMG